MEYERLHRCLPVVERVSSVGIIPKRPNSSLHAHACSFEKICYIVRRMLSLLHPSWCFYAGVIGVIGGMIFSLSTGFSYFDGVAWLIAALALLVLSIIISRRFCIVIAIAAGLIIASVRIAPELYGKEILASLAGQDVRLSGTISEDPNGENGNYKLRLKDIKIDFQGGESLEVAGVLYAQLSTRAELERSDKITLAGKLNAGFGIFGGSLYRPELIAIERAEYGDIFARIKHGFADAIKALIPAPEVDLGLGYLVGEKSGLSDEFSEQLRAVGMTHVVVASGAHLGILIGAVRKIFGKISRFAGALGAILAIFAFAMMVGFTPSMTRAAIVAVLGILAGYVGRKFSPLRLISFVAAITLLIDSMNLLNLGWQLSFASFFAILALAPRVSKMLYGGKSPPWLASMLITSITASLVCAPILIYNFGTISLLSLVANLIILPTLPYAMFLVFATGILSPVPLLASLIARVATLLLDLHIFVIEFLSEQKMFIMELPAGDWKIFLLYILIVGSLGWMMFRQRKPIKIPP